MWWVLTATTNVMVTVAYLAIALAIWRGLRESGQVFRNPLGLATSAIFFTCAVHHGLHAFHLTVAGGPHTQLLRAAFDTPALALWDVTTVVAGIWYWTLRGRFPALVRGAAVFEDLKLRETAERSLRASEERYRQIVETTDQGVLVVDVAGTVTFANARLGLLAARPVDDLVGAPVADLLATDPSPADRIPTARAGGAPPDDALADGLSAARAVAAGDAAALPGLLLHRDEWPGDHLEMRLLRPDGDERWVRVTAAPLLDDGGAVTATLVMMTDVTEQRRLEAQIRQSQKLEAVGQLASGVAHDFNNLLTVIDGYAAMLLDGLPESRPERRDAEHIRTASARATRLTAQLIAFSRDQHVQLRLVDLNEVIADLRELLTRLIPADIELTLTPAPQPALIQADRSRIEQVLVNLVVNARDAMVGGGMLSIGAAAVELAEREAEQKEMRPGAAVMLTVTDTGTGMSAAVRARALEPFFTTKGPGQGTGLGLSTVYGIVRQFGGHLGIFSQPGLGTTIKVLLPRDTSAVPVGTLARAQPAPPAAVAGSETILLAEDDDAVRELVARMLSDAGYSVLQARDGVEADRVLSDRADIDLLVTDVVMPGWNGSQLVRRLLETHRRRLPVLYTSAYTRGLITHQGLLDPAVAYLEKPFTTATLTEKIRAVLDAGT